MGTILETDQQLLVKCGQDALSITQIQQPGGKAMGIKEFLNGYQIDVNEVLQ